MKRSEIEKLLDKYYEGETSPEEELILHLFLLDEPVGSPLVKHLAVIEGTMQEAGAMSHAKKRMLFPTKWLAIAASAIVMLFLAGGYLFYQRSPLLETNLDYPLSHKEATLQAQRAFNTLFENIQASQQHYSQAYEQLQVIDQVMINQNSFAESNFVPTAYEEKFVQK